MKPYYEAGGVTIYHGDCRDVLPGLKGVELVLTDPPYAKSGSRAEWKVTASVAIGLHQAARLVPKGGAMLAFTTSSGRGIEFTLGAVGNVLPFNRVLTWHKAFVRSRVAGPWRWDTVQIICFGRCSFGRPEASSCFRSTGPASTKSLGGTGHPGELPDGIGAWLYKPFSQPWIGAVLDPFMGTGQLLHPAVLEGRPVVGVETDERWCEAAVKRLTSRLDEPQAALFGAEVA